MSEPASVGAWRGEPDPVDERSFTPRAGPGWHAWNPWSPEVEICDFVAQLAAVVRPRNVIETGTGQGFVTRRVAAQLHGEQRLSCYESSAEWRGALSSLEFFRRDGRSLAAEESPDEDAFASAELCLLDSDFAYRLPEIQRWWRCAPSGAVLFVHDAGNPHVDEPEFALTRATIEELGIPGFFLANPRGGFVGHKPRGAASVPSDWVANRLVAVEEELRTLRATKTLRYSASARRVYASLRRSRRRGEA